MNALEKVGLLGFIFFTVLAVKEYPEWPEGQEDRALVVFNIVFMFLCGAAFFIGGEV